MMKKTVRPASFLASAVVPLVFGLTLPGCQPRPGAPTGQAPGGGGPITLRVGHFPNVTHAQGLVAHALSRRGKGWFEERLGPGVKIEWSVYNAGPSAMEALFAGSLDLAYVGPSPAINAYFKAKGEEIRILAGAAYGGAGLVVQGDGRIKQPSDFRGRKIATPQLGNTQDVACRAWLVGQGFKVTQLGGEVEVLPTSNPDQLSLFESKALDGVWTVEPWLSRLEVEGGGKLYLEEKDTVTTVLVSDVALLRDHAAMAKRFIEAHAELTGWIKDNAEEARKLVAEELKAETLRELKAEILDRAWSRLNFSSAIELKPLESFVTAARSVGFLRDAVDLGRILESPR